MNAPAQGLAPYTAILSGRQHSTAPSSSYSVAERRRAVPLTRSCRSWLCDITADIEARTGMSRMKRFASRVAFRHGPNRRAMERDHAAARGA